MPKKKEYVWMLICEDASHLGGPMGTEYTTLCWTKPFGKMESAKEYAEEFIKQIRTDVVAEWNDNKTHVSWDALSHIFTIRKEEIK